MSEGEFQKRSLTRYDMLNKLRQIAKDTGYAHEDGTIHPTEENIGAQTDYEYVTRFVPIDVIDEARKEFPIKAYKMELSETSLIRETTHLEFDRPSPEEFLELMKWVLKWFGVADKT